MRLFIAIELPEEVRRHLQRVRDELSQPVDLVRAVSWVKRENWHITVKFLGDVEDAKLPELLDALKSVPVSPMTVACNRTLFFPKRGPVHVIAVGLGGAVESLDALHARIEETCASIGFPCEKRAYTAHITIGRSRQGERGSAISSLRHAILPKLFPGPAFQVGEFVLMESRLSAQGSTYVRVATFPAEKNSK